MMLVVFSSYVLETVIAGRPQYFGTYIIFWAIMREQKLMQYISKYKNKHNWNINPTPFGDIFGRTPDCE